MDEYGVEDGRKVDDVSTLAQPQHKQLVPTGLQHLNLLLVAGGEGGCCVFAGCVNGREKRKLVV